MKSFFQMTRALVARKRKIFALFFALAASVGMSWAQTPSIVSSGTKGGMSYTFYDNGLLEISGSGALPGNAFTNWDGGFGTSVKNIRFAKDCEVYGLDYLWFACYTENSQLETVEINSVTPIMFSGSSGAGIFYRQDGAVTLTITAPGIVDVESEIIGNYGSPVNMIFNMPATTVFEKKWFSGLRNNFAVTIPTGAKGHIPAGYIFKDSYHQRDYDDMVAHGHEDMFWEMNSNLEEGVDYTLGVESTFVITAENASQIFGQATVSFQAPTEASNSEWVLWRKSDLKEFPDMSSGDQKVCKDVTVKVNNGVYNTNSGYGLHFESSGEDGVQFVAPEGKVFKRIVILNGYGTFSDPNWSYDSNYKKWSGSANTVGFVGNICNISLIEFELEASAPANACGDGLTWELKDGALTISYDGKGTGVMNDYSWEPNAAPWYAYRNDITSVSFPEGITTIGAYAFVSCDNAAFTTVTIPEGVTALGVNAFYNCDGIQEITIPSTVTTIGVGAIYDCKAVNSITSYIASPTNLHGYAIYGYKNTCTLYVPYASIADYQAAECWKEIPNIAAIPGTLTPEGVIEKINAIGEVAYTAECKAKIDEARAAYNALSDGDKAQITNIATLTGAETAYKNLVLDAAQPAIAAIKAIPSPITSNLKLSAYEKVTAAREAYDALTDEEKAAIPEYLAILEEAEAAFAAIPSVGSETVITWDKNTGIEEISGTTTSPAYEGITISIKGGGFGPKDEMLRFSIGGLGLSFEFANTLEGNFQKIVISSTNAMPSTPLAGMGEGWAASNENKTATWTGDAATVKIWDGLTATSFWDVNTIQFTLGATVSATEAAQAAKDLIDAIGEVSYPGSKEAIKAAREAVDALGANASLLDDADLNKLTQAEAAYAQLLAQAVAAVKDQIDALPATPLTDATKKLSEYNKVTDAREAYDALSDEEKAAVTNYGKLEAAEAAFAAIGGGTGLNVSTEDIGKVLCADGSLYATKDEATAASKTPVAMIAYVEDSKGLAIALEDESNTMIWSNAITTAAAHTPAVTGGTWKLPSLLEWQQMFVGCGADLTPSETSGEVTDYLGLRDKLLAAGGNGFVEWSYWTTTEWADNPAEAWDPYFSPTIVKWYINKKDRDDFYIRAILAFNVVASTALADAQAAKDLIDAIPQEVVYTPECGAAIKAAREAVDALGENASLLDDADLNKLTQAEATYAGLLAQAVAAVKEQIEALPDTPLTDATKKLSEYNKVLAAREAYDALSDEEKAAVTNYGKLTAAEAAFAAIDKGGITIYDSGSVALTDLKIGDVLKGGVTLIGEASDKIGVRRVAMNGETKEGVFYNLPFQYMNPLLGENAAISHGPNVFSPIAEDGNAGDAWIVTDKNAQATVWLRGISSAALPSVLADAQAAKDLIDAIPQEVVLSDECNAAIQAARDAVTALGENASLLDDADIAKLAKAEADFALLIQDATAVADKIAAIGEVTFSAESKGKIEDAREAYEALSDELKPYVSNLGTLTAAEAAYEAARPFAPVTTVPAAVEALQYTGAAQALITAGAAEHGTVLYSLDGENYSTELPTALLPGAYTIYYKVQATDDYKDVAPVTVIATIAYNYPATYGLFGIPEGWSVKVNDEEVAVVNGAVKNIAANDRFDIMPVKPEDVKRVEIVPYLLDLATVTDSVIYILDGDSITGTANGHITVVIVPDAKVYFKDVNLTNTGSHPAVLCGGNAEIVVVGENTITCTKEDEYGIRAAGAGTTLTVSGDKTLLKATIDPNGGTVNQ